MKFLVCGTRRMADGAVMEAWLRMLLRPGDVVVHGGARGADAMAGEIATRLGYEVRVYEADWSKGNGAGPQRNQRMLDAETPDVVLAFPIHESKGTWDMVRRAKRRGVRTVIGSIGDGQRLLAALEQVKNIVAAREAA